MRDSDDKTETVYMCGVDWQHEIGCAMGGNRFYPSVKDAEENCKCVKSCGLVEVEVRFKRWVIEQDLLSQFKQQSDEPNNQR